MPVIDADGNPTPEFHDWIEFVDELIQLWLAAAAPGATLWTCPEMIASGYRLSVFTDNWRQALFIRDAVADVWRRRLPDWTPPA